MPKKTTASRSGAQRNRPRAQKSIEVVHQPASVTTTEQEPVTDEQSEKTLESYAATPAPATTTATSTTRTAAKTKTATPVVREEPPVEQESPVPTAPKGSSATLITAEHYAYVKRDLVTIAILASFMFVAIIVLYFILARGF